MIVPFEVADLLPLHKLQQRVFQAPGVFDLQGETDERIFLLAHTEAEAKAIDGCTGGTTAPLCPYYYPYYSPTIPTTGQTSLC